MHFDFGRRIEMAGAVYILCSATALLCSVLLWRGYRRDRIRLLLWATVCFGGLAVENALLFVDHMVIPDTDLSIVRRSVALVTLLLFLYGLICETK
jgi:hypothetical protein